MALGNGLSTSERKLPMRMATATTVLTRNGKHAHDDRQAAASVLADWAVRRCEGSLGVGPVAGLSAGVGRPGSSVVTVDQLEPSQ